MSAPDNEAFLSRWSRRKVEERTKEETPPATVPAVVEDETPLPPLQPIEELTPESDFTPFMNAKVPMETRRAALKKLFADPQFSVPDVNEAYSGDWTVGEPIPLEMLKTLNQAQRILFNEPEAEAKPQEPAGEQAQAQADTDEVPKEEDVSGSDKQPDGSREPADGSREPA